MKLLIVESPTKAKTITRFIGKGFKVQSSFGHLRDLPKSKMGVDVEKDFKPSYIIPTAKRKQVTILKKEAKKANEIYYATDEDREGEAIAWHLAHILEENPKKTKRITFHEITKDAIVNALKEPRTIDMDLVNAQQARRILDRLVGYELSPFLWRKVAKGLSAGRVQSVAVRLIVERERERQAFKPKEYWSVEAILKNNSSDEITAKLHSIDDKTLDKFDLVNEKDVKPILKDLKKSSYVVDDIAKKEVKRNPYAPFTTSTLQQEANRRFGFSAKQTMMLAQQLYEGIESDKGHIGLITYMRTDSVTISDKFLTQARNFISDEYGKDYLPSSARRYKTKSKMAQEAHEAIRPTEAGNIPSNMKKYLNTNQAKLYDLIWRRAISSQMNPAVIDQTTISVKAGKYGLRSTGSVIVFPGFLKAYGEKTTDNLLPKMEKDDELKLEKLVDKQHFTEPPARYSDATLVKALEEFGIGRPSTYAPTIATIIDRNYVERDESKRLGPTEMAFLVTDLLTEHFPHVVDFKFTAELEENLDKIADGSQDWVKTLKDFYDPFHKNLEKKEKEITKKDLTEEETGEVCDKCGKPMIKKIGRYGTFMACSGFPDCKNTKPLAGKEEKMDGDEEPCPKCGKDMVVKHGRYGAFLACSGYPDCKYIKKTQNTTGVKCPECAKNKSTDDSKKPGEIISRRSKRGKMFYGCSSYPKCDFALWYKPTGNKCPDCESLLVEKGKNKIACSSKECGFEK